MAEGIVDRFKHAWSAFTNRDRAKPQPFDIGASFGHRPDRIRLSVSNERSIVSAIYTRLAIDVSLYDVRHIRVDQNDRYLDDIRTSRLYDCLTLEANIDQTAQALKQDYVTTMFDRGHAVIVPVETTENPTTTGGFDINSLRVGYVTSWFPRHVTVSVYNDRTGHREDVTLPKSVVAIIENPLYAVMNEPNSTLQRLIMKLNMLDLVDKQSSSGKLDIIIQLPYAVKSDARREQAALRRAAIETQLRESQYGIAYIDSTESITQLNRAAENNLLNQVTMLTEQLYSQLGITKEVFEGTASEAVMLNYYSRTIQPILKALVDEMRRKFLTKTARTQGQSIGFFRDAFSMVTAENLAELSDKFTRNEILSSNDIRAILGLRPDKNPKSDQLVNSNIHQPNENPKQLEAPTQPKDTEDEEV